MSTTLDAIYEHGIFKPISGVPVTLRENERVRITIETNDMDDLKSELAKWDAASDEDLSAFERQLEEIG